MGTIFDFGDVLAGNAEALGELGTGDAHFFAQSGDTECEGVFCADDGDLNDGGGGRCGCFLLLDQAVQGFDGCGREACHFGGCRGGVRLGHVHGELFEIGGSFEFFDQLVDRSGGSLAALLQDGDITATYAEPVGEFGFRDTQPLTQGKTTGGEADKFFFRDWGVWHSR